MTVLDAKRKMDHIDLCLHQDVEGSQNREAAFLEPRALPEFSLDDVSLNQKYLGHTFSLPLFITGMTGGVKEGAKINKALAVAAEMAGIPMGLGSQKMAIGTDVYDSLFAVRDVAKKVFLIGNLGAVSLNYGVTVDDVKRLVDKFELNAFALHVNVLQECIQPEGERNFTNLYPKIALLAQSLPVPLIIKEVGCGIDLHTFKRLAECGVASVDVGGQGGTSWSAIEGMRGNPLEKRLGELFRNWGLSTEESLRRCAEFKKQNKLHLELTATGGIRDGLQVAKAVALGATMCGVGLPLFKAAANPQEGKNAEESILEELEFFKRSLAITLFCSGAKNLAALTDVLQLKNESSQ